MRYFLYKIVNKINNKVYVGKTKNFKRRWYEHQRSANQGKQHPLYDSIRKYGIKNFSFELIQETTEEEVNTLEMRFIQELSLYPMGYNLARGGEGGDTFTNAPEHVKDSRRLLHRNKYKANPQGVTTKSTKGKHITESCPEIKNKWKENHNTAMKRVSERRSMGFFTQNEIKGYRKIKDHWKKLENRQKRSELAKGVNNSRWLGYLEVYSSDGIILNTFESAKKAAEELGIDANTIRVKARNGEPYNCKKSGFKNYTGLTFKFNKK